MTGKGDPTVDGRTARAGVGMWRPMALVAVAAMAGAAGTLVVGAAAGMPSAELAHLALLLLPAAAATLAGAAVARPLLARSPLRHRLVAVAAVGAGVALANLVVLALLMVVDERDAMTVAILVLYSAAAGVGASWGLAKASSETVRRLTAAARELGDGLLDVRVGPVGGDAELALLASTLDDMAGRLGAALARERDIEARRRDLISAVSHDLRTPLASLRAMVEAIDEGIVDDPPTVRSYVREMRRSVDALVSLTDDLFEFVQIDAGAIERETQRARLADVVDSALAACESEAGSKGLSVRRVLDGSGDLACSPRLTRVLQNLLQNAIRHTPSDGTVWIEARHDGSRLEVSVRDSGEGIAPADMPNVFEPFWRADPARTGGGSGLGLSLAKRIVEALGGSIAVESEPRRGSRFAVALPLPATTPARPTP